ncbi:hypothetical protein B0H19DRAFT_1163640 [Mycena capillaripes]|nr:hypothetical protein B0H19DRAFT_1163640 [Mycena capillaripes]
MLAMLAALEADRTRAADIDARILDLGSQTSEFEDSLSRLQTEKALARERLDSYKYPVSTLPNEIISEIFLHFLPAYPLCPPLTGPFSPTSLTHICRKWREIALATPALWRAIRISRTHIVPLTRQEMIFNIWLSRSRGCPLSIHIIEDNFIYEIITTAVLHRARWEHIILKISPVHLPVIDGPMPLLRHIDLYFEDYPPTPMEAVAFRESPLLRTAILDDVAASLVILPWAQLTSLTLTRVYPHECIPILTQTSNLVNCKLSLYASDSDSLPDVGLPCLKSLVLDDPGPFPVTGYFETFIVPALRHLQIPEEFLGSNPINSLASFISKSGCKHKAFPSILKFTFSYYGNSLSRDSESENNSVSSDGRDSD